MSQIGMFFGTTTGKTAEAAERIQEAFGGEDIVTLIEIPDAEAGDFANYPYLLIGCPTWDIGELQSDWEAFFPNLDQIDFSGKKIAYFGTGDQIGYADNYMDAIGIIEAKITEKGGKTVGYWSTEGYQFDGSKAVRGNQFCGLALDEDNQSELSDERIAAWVAQVKSEFGL
ncbi:MAG: flavodoxin FldA [Acaryochloridaceae cyanobacterium CSU_3_4]|nr:flavodoxin FldA [Acaryochloridaceae cyanobacterium CSU_3_4]